MAGRPGGGFIQEEEFGVEARRHHLALAAFELQAAIDPALQAKRPHDFAVGVVDQAAVAEQRATGIGGDDLAKGRNSILQRHGLAEDLLKNRGDPCGGIFADLALLVADHQEEAIE